MFVKAYVLTDPPNELLTTISPDSLKKSHDFAGCAVGRNFINSVEHCPQQILHYSGLLVNSANVTRDDTSICVKYEQHIRLFP